MYTKEEQEQFFKDYAESEKKHQQELSKKWDNAMQIVKEEMGVDWYNELIEYLEEESCYYNPVFVETPKGKRQTIDGDGLIKEEWVNQTTNGGFTGDDFAGTTAFKMKEGKYLQLDYSM